MGLLIELNCTISSLYGRAVEKKLKWEYNFFFIVIRSIKRMDIFEIHMACRFIVFIFFSRRN